jgi:hypothetical protein
MKISNLKKTQVKWESQNPKRIKWNLNLSLDGFLINWI